MHLPRALPVAAVMDWQSMTYGQNMHHISGQGLAILFINVLYFVQLVHFELKHS